MDALLLNLVMQGASSLIYHALGKSVYSSALFQGVGWAFHILGAAEQFIVMDSTLPQKPSPQLISLTTLLNSSLALYSWIINTFDKNVFLLHTIRNDQGRHQQGLWAQRHSRLEVDKR